MAKVQVIDSGEVQRPKRRWWLWTSLALVIILGLAVGVFVVWASMTNPVMPEALAALESNNSITVSTRSWIAFVPHQAPPTTGFIFYPGGKVLAEAYAPLARRIAEEGYLVVIVYAPLNLAIINPNLADPVMEYFSAVEHWAVGGHSLGGTTAAIYAASHLDKVEGLAFLASFPADNALANAELQVVSIYGSNDGLASPEQIIASNADLPANTRYVEISGGNHGQFGYYGIQDGDGEATISHESQLTQTAAAIISMLEKLGR